MRYRPNRLPDPPLDYIDADFEEDRYPRRPMHPLRVWFRSHRRWIKSLHWTLRFGVIAAWIIGLPIALIVGAFYGLIVRSIIGY